MNKTTGIKNGSLSFHVSPGRIILTDPSFRVTQVSSAMLQLLGFDSETELLGAHALRDVIELAEDQYIIEHSIRKFGTLSWYPVTLKRRDGRIGHADIQVGVQKNYQIIIGYEFTYKTEQDPEPAEQTGVPIPHPASGPFEHKKNTTAGSVQKPPLPAAPPLKKTAPSPGLLEDHFEFVIDETTNPFLARPMESDETPQQGQDPSNTNIVLIIDDDPAILDVNSTVLNFAGYQTVSTKSLEHGLQQLKDLSSRVTVVLLDFSLLELIGEENINNIAKISPHSALILSSGHTSEPFKKLLAETKAGWLQKPYSSTQLIEAVAQQIAARKLTS